MIKEDLSTFFNPDELGESFSIPRLARDFNGILEREYVEVSEISGYQPIITCAVSDANGLQRGDLIRGDTGKFKFIQSQPDGTGITRLILNEYEA